MTSIRDLLGESLGVGETYRLRLEERDGRLVAVHPNDASPMDIVVVEGLDRLEERPPAEPVAVEIIDRVIDDRIAARAVDTDPTRAVEADTNAPDRSDSSAPDR